MVKCDLSRKQLIMKEKQPSNYRSPVLLQRAFEHKTIIYINGTKVDFITRAIDTEYNLAGTYIL